METMHTLEETIIINILATIVVNIKLHELPLWEAECWCNLVNTLRIYQLITET